MGGMTENTTRSGAKGATKGALEAGREKFDEYRGDRRKERS
jgi:gas vesicle structural protein